MLITYDEVCAARYSLPEFHGTTPEDPVRFIHKAESILYQTRIDRSAWTNIVTQQLKGPANTWWNAIRLLGITWDKFRAEFLEKFDNVEIQSRLRAEIVSVRETPTQSLMEFVTKKNQLARRVNTGLSETQLVGTIAGLTRNEYRTHLRLQRPATFRDLRWITGILEYTPDEPPPPPQPKPENKKFGSANTQRPPHQKQTRDDAAEKPLPSNPCSGRVERTKLIEHDILLKNQTPIALKSYPYPQLKQATIDTMIRDMKEQRLVEQSTSPWAAPVVLAKKKDGSPRLCIDYRRLNDITEYDAYLMPDLNTLIRQMRGAKVYSVLDLKSGY
ncbi:hypothetical protein QTP88_028321 [Uroleucon formosanum]